METKACVFGSDIPSLSLGAEMAKQVAQRAAIKDTMFEKENAPSPQRVHKYVVPNPHRINYKRRDGSHACSVENVGTSLHLGPKVGRNALCPCGSGKKYKHCCIDSDSYATDKILIGFCHGCGGYIYDKDEVPEHASIFECQHCGHPWHINEIKIKEIR